MELQMLFAGFDCLPLSPRAAAQGAQTLFPQCRCEPFLHESQSVGQQIRLAPESYRMIPAVSVEACTVFPCREIFAWTAC